MSLYCIFTNIYFIYRRFITEWQVSRAVSHVGDQNKAKSLVSFLRIFKISIYPIIVSFEKSTSRIDVWCIGSYKGALVLLLLFLGGQVIHLIDDLSL